MLKSVKSAVLNSDTIAAVRELMSRNLDCLEISHRLHLDPYMVQAAIDFINGILT